MTREQITDALDAIESTLPGCVYASRRGHVAAVPVEGGYLAIRKVDGECQAERWPRENMCRDSVEVWTVPASLQERARQILEAL